jgi:hypothetical protein
MCFSATLALLQLPLTLGNAILAIHEENNRLFTGRGPLGYVSGLHLGRAAHRESTRTPTAQ